MKNPRFTKTIVSGALILGVSATGATVWASTNGSLKTLTPATIGTSANKTSENTSLMTDYATYVQTSYQQIQSAVQANKLSEAQHDVATVQKTLKRVNTLIQNGQISAADSLLGTATPAPGTSMATQNLRSTDNQSATTSNNSSSGPKTPADQHNTDNIGRGDIEEDAIALSSALQHSGNARAQASLENNIAKAFAHLHAQLQNMQKIPKNTQTPNQTPTAKPSSQNTLASVTITPVNGAAPNNPSAQSGEPSSPKPNRPKPEKSDHADSAGDVPRSNSVPLLLGVQNHATSHTTPHTKVKHDNHGDRNEHDKHGHNDRGNSHDRDHG